MIDALLSVILLIAGTKTAHATYSARVWKSLDDVPSAKDFPESSLLSNKPNAAIAFTGGGSRSYVASIGYLAALTQLDLIKNVRYIGGISGGAWATLTYSFVQTISDDKTFLGPILNPEELNPDNLKDMDPSCARGFAAANLIAIALEAYTSKTVDSAAAAWAYGISKTYLEPAGINPKYTFTWNQDSLNDILKRNKQLSAQDFYLPVNANRPFPVVGSALVGPADGAPYDAENQNYTMLEITPLYVGQLKNLDVSYNYKLGLKHTRKVGGAVEPFAFALKGSSPRIGIAQSHTTALLDVPEPIQAIDIQFAASASSYAIGSFVESIPFIDDLGMHIDYWSPAETLPSAKDTFFADGGCYENIPLINFIQRRVAKIVLFWNSVTPLQPKEKWNVNTDDYDSKQVTNDLSAFFGVIPPQAGWENRSYEYERNQVFAKSEYARLITAMQDEQAKGNGIFVTLDLTTIENSWWGVPAGLTFQITFVYLGRIPEWEQRLSPEMQAVLIPATNRDDLSHDVEEGPFKSFPHYPTTGGGINNERANALADLTAWSILQHADLFRSILQ